MLTTRVLTLLAAAAVALVLAPASSSARPIEERAEASHMDGCYQLNPVVPGQPRGVHRVLCGLDAPSSAHPQVTVSALHSQARGGVSALEALALAIAITALALSAVAVTSGRLRVRRAGVPSHDPA